MHTFAVQGSGTLIDWKTVFSIGIPALVAIGGWFLVHVLNSRREQANRRREARVAALERAFLRLASVSNRPLVGKVVDDLETFVTELQLYGTPAHVELLQNMVNQFINPPPSKRVDFDPLLEALRDGLRKELRLEPIGGRVWWLRIGQPLPVTVPVSAPNAPANPVDIGTSQKGQ